MRKVLIIAYNDLNNSGVPNVIYQTIKALHKEYCFDVLIFGDDRYFYQRLKKEGIDVNIISFIEQKPKSKIARLFWWFYKNPKDHFLFMKKLLKENEYSVIHSFKDYFSWPFLKAAKKAGVEKRILHRNVNPEKPKRLVNKLLELKNSRLSLKYASVLVGVSEVCCKNSFKNHEYVVLYNSYDEQKYNMSVNNKLTDDELVVTQVASYSENKNQLFSLYILRELKKLYVNTRLNLVGAAEKTPYYQILIDYAKTNNLQNDVSFIDKTDKVYEILEKSTFSLIPSIREGFCLAAVESQACGISVFASSSIPEEVDCGGIIFLELSKGPTVWAETIYKLFKKQKNSRANYDVKQFSFNKFKDSLADIYNK